MSFETQGLIASFPAQKKSRAQKTKKWYKECIDAGHSLVEWENDTGIRANLREKVSNYNLYNDIVDPKEVEAVMNPYKIESETTNEYRNYPLANPNINVLLGEERKRLFNPIVTAINSDAVSQKMEEMTTEFNEILASKLTSEEFDEDGTKKELEEFGKWSKFNFRDRRERMASQIVKYGYSTLDLKEEFSRAFEDLLIAGEEASDSDILGGKPVLSKVNPLNLYTLKSGESYKIEDSNIIIISGYHPVGQVIDDYFDELTDSNVKQLEQWQESRTAGSRMFKPQLLNKNFDLGSYVDQVGIDGILSSSNKGNVGFDGAFDDEGNVRVTKVRWKGMRKVGVLKYLDENGDLQKRYVDEDYPVQSDLGEDVSYKWISEWYEGVRIGDEIYVKMQPRKVQFRTRDNPSECHPGIVGSIFNVNSSGAKSLMSMMKPYQLMYNFYMHKLREHMMRYKGDIARLNTTMIPDNWGMDKWLFYMDQMGIAFEDPFNEGTKGIAKGKLAGNMNTNSGTIRIGDANIIQQILMILDFVERRLQDISGITPQRKGSVENRETLGGVERAVNQSSHITEKYFSVHDDFRVRALKTYLETAKIAWKDNKFKTQYILDDGSIEMLDFDGEAFTETEYGINLTTASSDTQMMQQLQALSQAFMQNGGTLSMVAELYRTKDPASLQRKLEAFEEQLNRQQQDAEKANREAQAQAQQQALAAEAETTAASNELEHRKLDIEESNNIRDNETKLILGENQGDDGSLDQAKLDLQRDKQSDDKDIKDRQLKETTRKNKKDAEIKAKAANSKSTNK
jgi:hypothetical protein